MSELGRSAECFMKLSANTRKPANKLNSTDLQAFPVWAFDDDVEGVDGQDETWVRPVISKVVRAGSYSQLVSTKFKTGSGIDALGYLVISPAKCTPTTLSHTGGGMTTGKKQVFLARFDGPMSDSMKKESIRRIAEMLKLSVGDLFPLQYELTLVIEGECKPRIGIFRYEQKAWANVRKIHPAVVLQK